MRPALPVCWPRLACFSLCLAAALSIPPAANAADPPTAASPLAAAQSPAPPAAVPVPAVPTPPRIDVYTIGSGDYFFSLFGHAAVCVTDDLSPAGRCYNWGTADFSDSLGLAWQVVRGRAQFWVGVMDLPRMLSIYMGEDRTLYRQRLPLSPVAAARAVELLHRVDKRSASLYTYHNIHDNCTTRIRDLINEASQAELARPELKTVDQPSFRSFSNEGFAGSPHLIGGALLLFGRAIDQPTSRYADMFLPRILRAELTRAFHVEPELIYARKGPSPAGPAQDGVKFLAGVGLFMALCVLLLGRSRRTWQALLFAGILPGLLGALLSVLLVASPLAELRYNEALFLCWPFDLFLAALPRPVLRGYLRLRFLAIGLTATLALLGALRQPLLGPILLVLPPLVAAWLVCRRWPHEGAH